MDFTFTPEQEALRQQAREFLAATPDPTWSQLAELGWTGVSVAEEDGGAGLTFIEEAVLFEELGRALYHGPFFSTVALTLPALPDELLDEIRSRTLAALAIEACGVARRALEYASEHASEREQFGRKIGVYQAVSHPLADAYTRLELARSLSLWAGWCVSEQDEQAPVAAEAAKA